MHLLQTQSERNHYDLRDLGVLDGPPLRGASTVVNSIDVILGVPRAALLIIDDETSTVSVRAASNFLRADKTFSAYGSVAGRVRSENATQAIEDVQCDFPEARESDVLGASSLLAAPVYGPDQDAIGCLVAVRTAAYAWTPSEIATMENFAHLITQEVVLRASFQTLKIISSERSYFTV